MFDVKCQELAEAFLSDSDNKAAFTDENVKELAQQIQDTIESFLVSVEDVAEVE